MLKYLSGEGGLMSPSVGMGTFLVILILQF